MSSPIWKLKLLFASPDAQFSEALRLWNAGDDAGALQWGRRAAKHLPLAKVVVAQWLLYGQSCGSSRASDEAITLLKDAAEAGFARSSTSA